VKQRELDVLSLHFQRLTAPAAVAGPARQPEKGVAKGCALCDCSKLTTVQRFSWNPSSSPCWPRLAPSCTSGELARPTRVVRARASLAAHRLFFIFDTNGSGFLEWQGGA
jgi:hypothetical protein